VTCSTARLPVAWIITLSLGGCSLAVDADRAQCKTNQDCESHGLAGAICNKQSLCVAQQSLKEDARVSNPGGEKDGGHRGTSHDGGGDGAPPAPMADWSCLEKPRVVTTEPGPFHVTMHVTTIVPSAPAAGVAVVLCTTKLDVECSTMTGDPQTTNSNGDVAFDVPRSFSGYAQLKRDDLITGLYFFNPNVDRNLDAVAVQLASPGILNALSSAAGSMQDPKKGTILMSIVDCNNVAAANAVFSAQGSDAIPFYSVGGLPNAMATTTDSSGYGGFVNVPPGVISIKGLIDGGKRDIGAAVSFLTRANSLSYIKLVPVGK